VKGRVRLVSATNEMLRHNPHSNAIGLRYSPSWGQGRRHFYFWESFSRRIIHL